MTTRSHENISKLNISDVPTATSRGNVGLIVGRLKTILTLKEPHAKCDGSELDAFDDLTVSEATEAKFLKTPTSSSTRKSHGTPALIRQLPRTIQPLPPIVSVISESPQRHSGVLALPRELRDEIYNYLLVNTYPVKSSSPDPNSLWSGRIKTKFDMTSFRPLAHPRFNRPPPFERANPERGTDTIAPWCPGAPGYNIIRQFEKEEKVKDNEALFKRRWRLVRPWDRLAIFYTSKATYKEAAQVLFDQSTFVLSIYQPLAFVVNKHVLAKMKNICIDVDLLKAYINNYSTLDQANTFEACRLLLCELGGTKIERTSCIVNFHRAEKSSFVLLKGFIKALKDLRGFKTVVIKLLPPYQDWWEEEAFARATQYDMMKRLFTNDIANLIHLDEALKDHLGPSTLEYMRYDFWCLVYHPRAHHTGSPPPPFNMDDLADPPAIVAGRGRPFSHLPRGNGRPIGWP